MDRPAVAPATSGIVLLAVTFIALVWANASTSYAELWQVSLGPHSLQFWIDDGLMAVFFLLVGLEIRREIAGGGLSTPHRAALPVAAALGGMIVPAAIYAVLNHGRAGSAGWAIPMATDIAFAVGVLTLLGTRVPAPPRVVLLALAVIDDLGAILVIALVYAGGVDPTGLAIAGAALVLAVFLRLTRVSTPVIYMIPGVVLWLGLLRAGLHPTLAGVALGFLVPVAHTDRLIRVLHPWVTFGVMPLFALANAGVVLGGADLHGDAAWVFLGIVVALVVGKPLGIVGASVLSTRLGLARSSPELAVQRLLLVGILGGIGFTMSLFIANLAFPAGPLLATAKLGILAGSGISMIAGTAFGALTLRARP